MGRCCNHLHFYSCPELQLGKTGSLSQGHVLAAVGLGLNPLFFLGVGRGCERTLGGGEVQVNKRQEMESGVSELQAEGSGKISPQRDFLSSRSS